MLPTCYAAIRLYPLSGVRVRVSVGGMVGWGHSSRAAQRYTLVKPIAAYPIEAHLNKNSDFCVRIIPNI